MSININEIFETVQKELADMPDIDIESLLQTAENVEYLENKTLHDIRKENEEALTDLNLSEGYYHTFLQKLEKYRYIKKLCDIHRGKYARWIKKNIDNDPDYDPKLSFGGIVCDIKFNDSGTYIQCFSCGKYYFSLKIDNFVFFQKLTEEEYSVLTIYTYCKNEKL
jgi:hypothetical protein